MADKWKVTMVADLNETETKKNVEASLVKIRKTLKEFDLGELQSVTKTFKQMADGTKEAEINLLTFKNTAGQLSKVTATMDGDVKNFSQSMARMKTSVKESTEAMNELASKSKITLVVDLNDLDAKKNVDASVSNVRESLKDFDLGDLQSMTKSFSLLSDGTKEAGLDFLTFKNSVGQVSKVTVDADGKVKEMSQTLSKTGKVANAQSKVMSQSMGGIKKNTEETSNVFKMMGERFSTALLAFPVWMAASTLFFQTVDVFKQVYEAVLELDNALLELSKVTNLSKDELSDFASEAAKMGKALNTTAAEVVNAMADFSRMGFSPEESESLAQNAIILTKIADGITQVEEASTAMIAILKGFNMEASESEHVINAINEVSNRFAIQTDQLADGLRRTGGVMSQANVSFEETIGLLTAGQESLQNIEKVSSGLITISTRLRGVSESGEAIDGLMPKLQRQFKEYANIDIQTVDGQLRSTYDILVDLSKVWDTLNDEQKSELGFLAAGTRQAPVLNAIMANLNTTIGATEAALNSYGSAQEEFTKVSERLQGKLDALGSSWNALLIGFLESDSLGVAIEGLTALVDVIADLNEALGGGTDAIGFIIPAIGGLSNALQGYATLKETISGERLFGETDEAKRIRELTAEFNELVKTGASIESLTDKISQMRTAVDYDETIKKIKEIKEEMARRGNADGTSVALTNLEESIAEVTEAYEELIKLQPNTNAGFFEMDRGMTQASKSAEDATTATFTLEEALTNLSVGVDSTQNALRTLANTQEGVDFAMESNIDSINRLALAYGVSADDIVDIQAQLTNILIENTRKRLMVIAQEYFALEEQAKMIMSTGGSVSEEMQRNLYGGGVKIGEDMFKLEALLDNIDRIEGVEKKVTKTKEKVTKATEEEIVAFKDLSDQIEKENIEAVKNYQDAIEELFDEESERMEELQRLDEKMFDDKISALEKEKDALSENKDIQDEISSIQEKQLEIAKAQEALENAKRNKNTRNFGATGWEWIADPQAVAEAQKNIDDLNKELTDLQQEQAYNDKVRKLDSQIEEQELLKQNKINWYDELERIREASLDDIKDIETNDFRERLKLLDQFIAEYNAKMATIGGGAISKPSSPSLGAVGASTNYKSTEANNYAQQMAQNSAAWHNATPEEKAMLAKENKDLAAKIAEETGVPPVYNPNNGKWDILQYKNGGDVSKDGLIYAHNGEGVLQPDMYKDFKALLASISGIGNQSMSAPSLNKSSILSGGDIYNVVVHAPNGSTFDTILKGINQIAQTKKR